jgi:hypothetical protein
VNRTLALCANDYGQTEAVNRGVLQMACRERLTEVSCLVRTCQRFKARLHPPCEPACISTSAKGTPCRGYWRTSDRNRADRTTRWCRRRVSMAPA